MKDTAKRIRAYKAALPGLKERLAAVALLLVVSTVMMISATFAWITLSRAPEVTGINTTISGNGNLEIALSDKDGKEPDEFDVDESLTKGVNVTLSNLEWGNLINLSDPSYGIDNLALRPAQLNTANLLGSPLWGAVYAEDGRITALDSNYAYAMFNGTEFKTSNEYGVRAIASYTATISGDTQAKYKEMRDAVQAASSVVNQKYADVIKNFDSLGTMISKYAQDKLDKSNPGTNLAPYLVDVLKVYNALDATMAAQKDAYVALANFQLYMHANNTGGTYTPVTWADLEVSYANYNTTSADAVSKNGAISLVNLSTFIEDLNLLETDISYLEKYRDEYQNNSTAYYWASGGDAKYNINNMISRLIDYSNMTIDLNDDGTEKKVSSLGASDATALLGANNKERKAYVYNGILRRVEDNIIGPSYRLNGNAQCTIRVTYVLTITVKGKAYTKASGPSTFESSFEKAKGTDLVAADQVAEDTYGMAVDLWVRTNAESTCLTLEGATAADENGNIIRYDGANRIWGRVPSTDTIYTTESTSQGGGSCYIYYADTPEDMARSLDLLDSMKVAFVSQGGTLLATAEMDTVNYCAVNGRVTVPLVLDTNTKTTYTYKDSMNQEVVGKAITTLTYDAAERITAIIYLDGTRLTNDNVLAASEIQGQLNIQFGSSKDLQTIGSNDLIDDVRTVTARVSNTEIDFDTAVSEADRKVTVTVEINGTTATDVQAFFVRAINSTQGSREEEMKFTKQADGTWTSDYVFTAPGDYYLRYVRLNGVDYALANPLHVTVSGFALKSVTWDQAKDSVVVRTSDGTFSTKVTVEFASNDPNKLPNTVQARFVRTDGNTVNVPLSRGTDGKWTGTGSFTTSGVYKLEYLVYTTNDSKGSIYKDLGDLKKTLDLALGMYVEVKDMTGKLVEDYKSDGVYDKKVEVRIYDNAGNAIEGLENAWLYYSNNGSASTTINSDLTWNAGKYDAILPIKTAGRWMFGYVEMKGGQVLTKASGSPTYTIISPDPVSYDDTSKTTYNTPNDSNIQFVPLTNDATIDGIKLLHADTADVSAVVYNASIPGEQKYITVPVNVTSRQLKLPTYTTGTDADGNPDQSTATQDGTWYVAAIILTNCYGEDKQYHGETNPIIWAGNDEISKAYAKDIFVDNDGKSTVTADEDFSKLATQVSGSLNVTFTAGATQLGSETTEFMHQFQTNAIGMGVTLKDNAGNTIPTDKIAGITLTVQYTDPADGSYGYKVKGASKGYTIALNNFDMESESWKVSSGDVWQYVGEYRVASNFSSGAETGYLTVTLKNGKTVTCKPGENGVPTGYTIRTAKYDANDIDVGDAQQVNNLLFGKADSTADSTTIGTFLQSYTLSGTRANVSLKQKDINGMQYAVVEDVTVELVLTHTGKSQEYGGYTFTDSQYKNLRLSMTAANGGSTYVAGTSVLLAGEYAAQVEVKIGDKDPIVKPLSNISVYSQKPDVTMALAADTPKTVTVNPAGGTAAAVDYDDIAKLFTANNTVINNGYSALLFASYRPFTKEENPGILGDYRDYYCKAEKYAHYELPSVTFTLNSAGTTCKAFTMDIGGVNDIAFGGNESVTAEVGRVQVENIEVDSQYMKNDALGIPTLNNGKFVYKTHNLTVAGTQEITQITATVAKSDGTTESYRLMLANPLSIVQENTTPPSATFVLNEEDEALNLGFVMPDTVVSEDGRTFTFTLPASVKTSSGATTVTQRPEPGVNPGKTETTGEDPDEIVKTRGFSGLTWTDGAVRTDETELLYTETSNTRNTGSHKHLLGSYKHYQHVWQQTTYQRVHYSQNTSTIVTVKGTTKLVTTTTQMENTYSLQGWLVNGKLCPAGSVVEINGNSIITAVLTKDSKIVNKTVETSVTDGETDYLYEATCLNVTKTTKQTTYPEVISPTLHCEGAFGRCTAGYVADGKSGASKDTSGAPKAPQGYKKVDSIVEGEVRDTSAMDGNSWKLVDATPKTGTTTNVAETFDASDKLTQRVTSKLTGERLVKKTTETFDSNEKLIRKEVTTYTYDASGNRTSETIVYDGNGNIISGG